VRALAGFIIRGRTQAVMVAAVCTVLSVLLAPLSYVGAAVIGLVALRKGAFEGLVVMAGASLAAGVLTLLVLGTAIPALALVVILWLPLWLLALLLRQTASQGLALAVAGLLGLAGIAAVHLAVDSPADWWREALEKMLVPAFEQQGVALDTANLEAAARIMTGLVVAVTVLGMMLSLFLARWWQGVLYRPGGFGEEFRALRLDRRVGVATLVAVLASLLAGDAMGELGLDVIMLAVVLYMIQGLAVAHALVASRGVSVGWLVGLYLLLFLLWPFAIYAILALGLVGFADSWLDFRARFGTS